MTHQPFWKPLVRAAERVADQRSPKRSTEPGLPRREERTWPAFPMRHSDAGKPMQPHPQPATADEPSVLDLPIG